MSFDANTTELIRERIEFAQLVGRHTTLKPRSGKLLGLCPFHQEKTPSFTVDPARGLYYCFGCGAGGDVFRFVMETQHVDFPEAVRILAQETGVELPERGRTPSSEPQIPKSEALALTQMAAEYYERILQKSELAVAGRDYLKSRDLLRHAPRFQIGFAPDGDYLSELIRKKGLSIELADQLGLVSGSRGDRFRKRPIFPIHDIDGRAVAFGARQLPAEFTDVADDGPKYINSKESPIFQKRKTLYALSQSAELIKQRGWVALVEGYTDAIRMIAAGIPAAATMGTSMTAEHARLVRRFTRRLALIFDSDEAGRRAVERALPLVHNVSLEARWVRLPDGDDPDDYFSDPAHARLELDEHPEATELWAASTVAAARSLPERGEVMERFRTMLGQIEDRGRARLLAKVLGKEIELPAEELLPTVRAGVKTSRRDATREPSGIQTSDKWIVAALAAWPEVGQTDLATVEASGVSDTVKQIARLRFERVPHGNWPEEPARLWSAVQVDEVFGQPWQAASLSAALHELLDADRRRMLPDRIKELFAEFSAGKITVDEYRRREAEIKVEMHSQ